MVKPSHDLSYYRDRIYSAIDGMVLTVGGLLFEARSTDPDGFNAWVTNELPFSVDTARRLIAIYLAYRELPAETLARLPKPWQALFALRALNREELLEGVESGVINPSMTIEQARRLARTKRRAVVSVRYTSADLQAGALMDCDPNDIDPMVWAALIRWMSLRASD